MKRLFVMLAVLSLVLPVLLAACGGGDEGETSTATASSTATLTSTVTLASTATPTYTTTTTTPISSSSGEPVKVGVLSAWSGPLGASGYLANQVLAVVEKKVKDEGGLLGGRELKIIKYDTRGAVADAVAGATKMVKEDNVCALAWGGVNPGEFNAVATLAEELKVLFVPIASPAPGRLENELKYTILASAPSTEHWTNKTDLIINKLKPKTLGFLYYQDAELDKQIEYITEKTEAAGIKTVYYQLIPQDAVDLSPYLTKIKYDNPDVLLLGLMTPQALTAAKQVEEIGGWGNIQVVGIASCLEAAKLPGSVGWIVETAWEGSQSNYPASIKFVDDFEAANGGKAPTLNHIWFYSALWTIVEAVKQAGTDDRATVAQYARSGNLQWDTPMGIAHFTPDGNSGLKWINVRILEGGKTSLFE